MAGLGWQNASPRRGISPMDITVREMTVADRTAFAKMRATKWPEESPEQHLAWIDRFLRDGDAWAFVAAAGGALVGFAEVAIRKYANGCESTPVPFLEAIWVEPGLRHQGIGKRLIGHIEAFLTAHGYRELGSDARIENGLSHAAHQGWGFSETERVVYVRKSLIRQG
jgi:aminoglycoside 6'-N-acetyltransferase I